MEQPKNSIYFRNNGKLMSHDLPNYGIITLTVVNQEITMIETTEKIKVKAD